MVTLSWDLTGFENLWGLYSVTNPSSYFKSLKKHLLSFIHWWKDFNGFPLFSLNLSRKNCINNFNFITLCSFYKKLLRRLEGIIQNKVIRLLWFNGHFSTKVKSMPAGYQCCHVWNRRRWAEENKINFLPIELLRK